VCVQSSGLLLLGAHNRADMEFSLGARSKSHVASPPSAPLATRWSCFTQYREVGRRPRIVIGRRHPMSRSLCLGGHQRWQQEAQAAPSRDHEHDQPWQWCEAHLNRHSQRQASGEAALKPLQDATIPLSWHANYRCFLHRQDIGWSRSCVLVPR
jgi:hypothetical protein